MRAPPTPCAGTGQVKQLPGAHGEVLGGMLRIDVGLRLLTKGETLGIDLKFQWKIRYLSLIRSVLVNLRYLMTFVIAAFVRGAVGVAANDLILLIAHVLNFQHFLSPMANEYVLHP
jgi:hypothetical protein